MAYTDFAAAHSTPVIITAAFAVLGSKFVVELARKGSILARIVPHICGAALRTDHSLDFLI